MLQEKTVPPPNNSRLKSRAKQSIPTVERTLCGRPRLNSPVLTIWYLNGISVHQAIKPMRSAGVCVECHIAWMIEAGLIEPSVHCGDFFRGLGEDIGPLLASLDHVTLHDRPRISLNFLGGRA